MKKLVLLCTLILVAGVCFAQNGEAASDLPRPNFFNLELTVGVPIHWTNSPSEHEFFDNAFKDRTVTANTAFGVALLFNFGNKFGLTLDGDFFFGTDVMGASRTSAFSNSLFGANVFLGPVFYLYSSSFLRVPLAIGGHFSYWSSSNYYPAGFDFGTPQTEQTVFMSDIQMGPGAYIGMQFHFNSNLYMFSRTNVALTVYRIHKVEGNVGTTNFPGTHKEVEIGWIVKPTLGLGIKF